MAELVPIDIPVWRILPVELLNAPNSPARASAGRFHHSGQIAAYASLSAEGAAVAIKRYLSDGIERKLVPMHLTCERTLDRRNDRDASIGWQDIHANGQTPPTWVNSDEARLLSAQAMLYSSRSRPDLSHVVVFEPDCLSFVGPVTNFTPGT
ncbi:MAG: RES family NAD+ phosphorylase [Lentilitoribacter sp.]